MFRFIYSIHLLNKITLCFQNIPGTRDTKQGPLLSPSLVENIVNALEHILEQSESCSVDPTLQLHGL